MCMEDNLRRAWRWILSNPDFRYKSYFREAYSAYNLAGDANIKDLQKRLKNSLYIAGVPSKIYTPKKSGILRPYTLMPVEDQIVYQAYINIIAEVLKEKTTYRHYKTVFSNIYAGKRSVWFYKKWDIGYRRLNASLKRSYKKGYNYIASFDLTSFYDSIDHEIIRYFLHIYKFDGDFIDGLLDLLKRMSTNIDIIKTNGIPQGPLTSGLLSELILSYIDEKSEEKIITNEVLYFRYVDDIKLMAKDPVKLQKALSVLDFYCKQIGLYPQNSKIEIHEIKDISDEVKNISVIDSEIEIAVKENQVNSTLYKLMKNNKINDETKFKIYLSRAENNAKLANKLIDLLPNNINLIDNIGRYFENYGRKLSTKIVDRILEFLNREEVFQYLNGVLVGAIENKLRPADYSRLVNFLNKRYKRKKDKIVPSYKAEIISILIKNNKIKYQSIKKLLRDERDFIVIKAILKSIDINIIGEASYLDLLKICLKKDAKDPALFSAYLVIQNNLDVQFDLSDVNPLAQITLKVSNKISRIRTTKSIISECLNRICESNLKIGTFKWKTFFGSEHIVAQQRILIALSYARTDITAFVNTIDAFNDLFLYKLAAIDTSLGTYQLGNIGGFLNNGSALQLKYPNIDKMCKDIHNKRKDSLLSHPINKKTKKFTNRIEYKYIYTARKLLAAGYSELAINNPMA